MIVSYRNINDYNIIVTRSFEKGEEYPESIVIDAVEYRMFKVSYEPKTRNLSSILTISKDSDPMHWVKKEQEFRDKHGHSASFAETW